MNPDDRAPANESASAEDPQEAGPEAQVGQGDYVVEPGDTLASIAQATGHFWETIWNHPSNAELKSKRRPEVLLPGDRVSIPERVPKSVSCATGRRHVFRRRGVPVQIRFVIRDDSDRRFSGRKYELVVGSKTYQGDTGEQGEVVEWVEPAAREGRLTVWLAEPGFPETVVRTLRIGYVNPIESLSGIQARLNNLGFSCGAEDGELNPPTQAALRQFQEKSGLPATGEPDDPTRARLREEHGY
jgi:hypothetical protein